MKFKNRCILIICVILFIGIFIQFTRTDLPFDVYKNDEIIEYPFGNDSNLKNFSNDKLLIVYSDEYETYVKEKDNFSYIMYYTKKDYDVIKFQQFNDTDISNYSKIILLIDNNRSIGGNDKIFDFINNGGKVLYGNSLDNADSIECIKYQIGIEKIFKDSVESNSIKFLKNVMIKSEGVEIKNDNRVQNISYNVELNDNVEKYIIGDNDIPLLWKNKYGNGEIYYFNGTMLKEKSARGLIAGIISCMNGEDIYPIIKSKINFIDDFPSPVSNGENETIKKEYDMNIKTFYKNVWWNDMLEISFKNNIKYTGVIIGSYDNNTTDVSKFKVSIDDDEFKEYVQDILFNDGEIGIHGYNHQPLEISSYIDNKYKYSLWKDEKTISESMAELKNYVNTVLKDYELNVYVPPSNMLSENGINALKDSLDIKIISSIYDKDDTSDAYSQEFLIRDNGIIEMPRITYGYFFTDAIKWDVLNGANLYGYFSHFVHPDDVLDIERNNENSWNDMKEGYEKIQQYMNSEFWWIESDTATKGANKLKAYLNSDISYKRGEDYIEISCSNYITPISFILKTDKKIHSSENCNVNPIDDNTYLIDISNSKSKVYLE